MQAYLALEDGTVYAGTGFGAGGEQWGEVVFNTGMTGYQEVLTDPSYCGQIVVMTYPLIGNYGINKDDFEAKSSFVRGFVVKEACYRPSNWRVSNKIDEFLARQGIIGIAGIDTRALTRRIRNYGTMRGVICTGAVDPRELVEKAKSCPPISGQELVPTVATKEIYTVPGSGPRIALLDFGAKANIIRCLNNRGCEVIVLPPTTAAADILALNPQGVMLSNGPGDPTDVPYAIQTVKQLIGQLPIFGICLGHQILGLAVGGKTYKLKFGHRGANHPVKDLVSGRVYITSQNHGFAVAAESLPPDVAVSHLNLNDNTVEGLCHKYLPVFSVQYHPEAAPGPMDSEYLFDRFLANITQQAAS
ncbi:glutamine-hydrolyzing carbamoyl-phosphate synthase small subunit [Desulforamulus hydrothermalis]|uniref:Carbamoyl phosphate synthase small chain n=1 Tax=Desulforamulus hydrothermalis Lam5 = DSM 18033 TaxID=1121428 RepID=K8E6V6_9FIRM|nr:glutamine-hydrolyzing carbamoyl-phosphate synthase small subunit [Desulforamulus hydrothermalis]CCO07208.1 Carbamoyl-phosphate synthase small chain [Desulforamulus hydrothermalis Lam5 = DSM 18033]SHG87867.1 carbamoyl-phosphate synthase small subunit [Desulforamulus hydrothermalis Lam5 = DSM 18033]